MKLIFKDYTDDNDIKHLGFYISDTTYLDDIPEEFKNRYGDEMRKFNELYIKEREMVKKRKDILRELKNEFDEFMKKEYPQYYI
jgi:hypothetical protein